MMLSIQNIELIFYSNKIFVSEVRIDRKRLCNNNRPSVNQKIYIFFFRQGRFFFSSAYYWNLGKDNAWQQIPKLSGVLSNTSSPAFPLLSIRLLCLLSSANLILSNELSHLKTRGVQLNASAYQSWAFLRHFTLAHWPNFDARFLSHWTNWIQNDLWREQV